MLTTKFDDPTGDETKSAAQTDMTRDEMQAECKRLVGLIRTGLLSTAERQQCEASLNDMTRLLSHAT